MEDNITVAIAAHQLIPLLQTNPAFDPVEKKERIAFHFSQIMEILGLDIADDSLQDTPARVAKMYVDEFFKGLNPENEPRISLFDNKYNYRNMLIEKDIVFHSHCEHHFVPIIGRAHVAYLPGEKIIGLSKINRLVDYYASRPQVQERLTQQIAEGLKKALGHEDVAVCLEAAHLCVSARGIRDTNSSTVTSCYSGRFNRLSLQQEFLASFNQRK